MPPVGRAAIQLRPRRRLLPQAAVIQGLLAGRHQGPGREAVRLGIFSGRVALQRREMEPGGSRRDRRGALRDDTWRVRRKQERTALGRKRGPLKTHAWLLTARRMHIKPAMQEDENVQWRAEGPDMRR